MRISFVIPVALGLALACSRGEQTQATEAAEAPAGEPAPVSAAPAPYIGHDFSCPDGLAFNVKLDKGNALVTTGGRTLTLAPGEGYEAQYEGEGVVLVARGNEAMLVLAGEPARNCTAK